MTKSKNSKGNDAELVARKAISFEQAEGEAIPSQLKPGEISKELRAYLWFAVHSSLEDSIGRNDYGTACIEEPWFTILKTKHILRDHGLSDEFDRRPASQIEQLKRVYTHGNYKQVLGLTQWLMRQEGLRAEFSDIISNCLERARSAYAVYDGDTIVPISSEAEGAALALALKAASSPGLLGPKRHLKNAATELANGNWADSVRESIHAVEAVAKVIAPEAKNDALKGALAAVAKKHNVHEAMQRGFANLYGFTSNEQGIRHALLDKGDADVDGIDAQYMLGACASFVSYLLARARVNE